MLLDVLFLVDNVLLVLGVVALVLLTKGIITGASILLMGYPVRIAAAVSLALVQIGEFSFVLDRAGRAVGLSPVGWGTTGEQAFIAVTVLLMIATPGLMKLGRPVGEWLERTPAGRLGRKSVPSGDRPLKMEDHVIVVGYGHAGRRLGRVLREVGIPFEVIDLNPRSLEVAEEDGLDLLVGDASRLPILEHAAITRAKLLVVAINDAAAAQRIVQQAHLANPTLQIIVRTRFIRDVEILHDLGADVVVPEELETSVRIFSQVLGAYMIPKSEIEDKIRALRADDYGIFRGSIQEAHLMVLQGLDEEGLHTRAVAVREGAPVSGKTLAELRLRADHGITVLAVRRDGRTVASPDGSFRVQAGDRLVLIGTADQFVTCAPLFREAPAAQGD
jgi:CPA2 family monovalent cation:H+ antiporter-2